MKEKFEWILVVFTSGKEPAETKHLMWTKILPYPLYLDKLSDIGTVYRWEIIKIYAALVDILLKPTNDKEKLDELVNKGHVVTLGDYANIFAHDDTNPAQKFINRIKEFTNALSPHWAYLDMVPEELRGEVSSLVEKYSAR